jgi:flagellar biosynthesis protein
VPLPSETTPSDASREAVAARILELAQAHGMALHQSADLRELLAALQISDPIPIQAFAVVAEILFAILQANQRHQADWESMP